MHPASHVLCGKAHFAAHILFVYQRDIWLMLQADYTLRKLQQLKERITSTEGLVAIELDSRRNELVALNLVGAFGRPCLTCF